MKLKQGFTIVELVVVIVVIGILAAVALPRFLGLQDRAHDAVVEGTQAALASGVVMAKSVWLAEGRDSALDNIIQKNIGKTCVDNVALANGACTGATTPATAVSLDVNGKGYPVSHTKYGDTAAEQGGTAAATANIIVDPEACVEVFEFLLSESSVKATNKDPAAETPAIADSDYDFEFLATVGTAGTAAVGGTCVYEYLPDVADNQAAARTITYDSQTGRVTVANLSSVGTTSN